MTPFLHILTPCWQKHCKVASSLLVLNSHLCFSKPVLLQIMYNAPGMSSCMLNWTGLSVVAREGASSSLMHCLMNGRHKPGRWIVAKRLLNSPGATLRAVGQQPCKILYVVRIDSS